MLEDDLYDEMILPTAREDLEHVKEQKEKHSVYIGNFTWWTTDQELEDLVAGVGVTDLIDIQIHDNPANGLSKGYATVTVESMMSIRLMLIKLQDRVIHNRKIVVDEFTLENMQKYENIFNELVLKRSDDKTSISTIPAVIAPSLPFPLTLLPPPSHPPPPLPSPQPPVVLVNVSNYSLKPQVVGISRIPVASGLLQTVVPNTPRQLLCPQNIVSAPQPMLSSAAHQPVAAPLPPITQPLPSIVARKMLTKEEFEEIFSLNRAVVERSMERATLDAQEGLFSEAIETLVTAISLIKESRLGSDPQGIALMTPLKELLQDIEEQSIKRKVVPRKSPHSPGRLWSRDDFLGKSNHGSHSEERKSPPPKRRSHCERSPRRSFSIRHRSPSRRDYRRDGRSQERDHGYKFVDHQERNYMRKF